MQDECLDAEIESGTATIRGFVPSLGSHFVDLKTLAIVEKPAPTVEELRAAKLRDLERRHSSAQHTSLTPSWLAQLPDSVTPQQAARAHLEACASHADALKAAIAAAPDPSAVDIHSGWPSLHPSAP
ncbi:MAG: hypothetical protein WDN46_08235 [Methylocella sp.]